MLIDKYFDYQIKYENIYGLNTVVLMEVGSFYELYGVDNKKEQIGDIKKITDLLNIILTRRNKSIIENSRKNSLMAGFPIKYGTVLQKREGYNSSPEFHHI